MDTKINISPYMENHIPKYIGISPDAFRSILQNGKPKIKIKTKYGLFDLDFTHADIDREDFKDEYPDGCYFITSENGLKLEVYNGDDTISLLYDGVRYDPYQFIDPDDFGDDKENIARLKTIFKEFSNSADVGSNPLAMIIENNRKELQTLGFDVDKAKIALANDKLIYSKNGENELNGYGEEDVELYYKLDDGPVYYLKKRCFDYVHGQGTKIAEISWKDLVNGKIPNVRDEISELFHTGYLLYIGDNEGLKKEDQKIGIQRVWGARFGSPEYIYVQEVTIEALKQAFDKCRKMTFGQQNLIFDHPELIDGICKLFGISQEDLESLKEEPSLHLSNGSISCNPGNVKINYEDMIKINIEPAGDDYNLSVRDEHANIFIVPNKDTLAKYRSSDGWYYIDHVHKCFPGLRYYIRLDQDPYDMAIFDDKKIIVGRGPEYNYNMLPKATNPEDAENFEIDYSKYADHYFVVGDGDGSYEEVTYEEFLNIKNYNKE